MKEDLTPGRAAAAVFLGLFIGIVPIYGFQLLTAVGVAVLFKLNKPLTVAGTFINNALLRPLIIVSAVELGYLLRSGSFRPFHLSALTGPHMKEEILAFVIGSVALGLMVGSVGAAITAVVVQVRVAANPDSANPNLANPDLANPDLANTGLRSRIRFVKNMFAQCDWADRGFVRWKLRLDRIFGMLAAVDLGSGTVVDLGCGYGMALSFAAFSDGTRRLVGCDLSAHRITVARRALRTLQAELSVADVRGFEVPPAGLILILDVLQYLSADDQRRLLERCCAALAPKGILILRVHDRERGPWSAITLAFDRLVFAWGRAGVQPVTLPAVQYQGVLESSGMEVEERRFRNRLPLVHTLFIAKKLTASGGAGAKA
jgi:SAM-dependent methyltransferase